MKYTNSWRKAHESEYFDLLAFQNYGCAICGVRNKPLVVDHDHLSKNIRGLLCEYCNSWLGHHLDKDSRKFLLSAILYILIPPAQLDFKPELLSQDKYTREETPCQPPMFQAPTFDIVRRIAADKARRAWIESNAYRLPPGLIASYMVQDS